jgi:hypothetical protein
VAVKPQKPAPRAALLKKTSQEKEKTKRLEITQPTQKPLYDLQEVTVPVENDLMAVLHGRHSRQCPENARSQQTFYLSVTIQNVYQLSERESIFVPFRISYAKYFFDSSTQFNPPVNFMRQIIATFRKGEDAQ